MTAIVALLLLMMQWQIGQRGFKPLGGGGGTPTHIQACANQGGATAANVTCTFGSAVTAGDLIYCHLDNFDGSSPLTLSWVITGDTNSFSSDIQNLHYVNGSLNYNLSGFYLGTAVGSETVLTATATGLQFPAIGCDEYRNVHTKDQSDAGVASVVQGMTATSNSITPTVNNSLVIGIFAFETGTLTQGSGYTAGATTTWPSMAEYQVQSTAVPVVAIGTSTSSAEWAIHVVNFKP